VQLAEARAEWRRRHPKPQWPDLISAAVVHLRRDAGYGDLRASESLERPVPFPVLPQPSAIKLRLRSGVQPLAVIAVRAGGRVHDSFVATGAPIFVGVILHGFDHSSFSFLLDNLARINQCREVEADNIHLQIDSIGVLNHSAYDGILDLAVVQVFTRILSPTLNCRSSGFSVWHGRECTFRETLFSRVRAPIKQKGGCLAASDVFASTYSAMAKIPCSVQPLCNSSRKPMIRRG
jgi:hypothetical protein